MENLRVLALSKDSCYKLVPDQSPILGTSIFGSSLGLFLLCLFLLVLFLYMSSDFKLDYRCYVWKTIEKLDDGHFLQRRFIHPTLVGSLKWERSPLPNSGCSWLSWLVFWKTLSASFAHSWIQFENKCLPISLALHRCWTPIILSSAL